MEEEIDEQERINRGCAVFLVFSLVLFALAFVCAVAIVVIGFSVKHH